MRLLNIFIVYSYSFYATPKENELTRNSIKKISPISDNYWQSKHVHDAITAKENDLMRNERKI